MTTTVEAAYRDIAAHDQPVPSTDSLYGQGRPDKRMLYIFTGVLGSMPIGFNGSIAAEFDAIYAGKEDIDEVPDILKSEEDVVLGRFFNTPTSRFQAINMAKAGRAALMVVNVSTPYHKVHERLQADAEKKQRDGNEGRLRFDPLKPRNLKQMIHQVVPAEVDEGIHFVMNIDGSNETGPLLDIVEFNLEELGLLEV